MNHKSSSTLQRLRWIGFAYSGSISPTSFGICWNFLPLSREHIDLCCKPQHSLPFGDFPACNSVGSLISNQPVITPDFRPFQSSRNVYVCKSPPEDFKTPWDMENLIKNDPSFWFNKKHAALYNLLSKTGRTSYKFESVLSQCLALF